MTKRARLDDDKNNPCQPLTELVAEKSITSQTDYHAVALDPTTFYDNQKDNLYWIDENQNRVEIITNYESPKDEKWECKCCIGEETKLKLSWIDRLLDKIFGVSLE